MVQAEQPNQWHAILQDDQEDAAAPAQAVHREPAGGRRAKGFNPDLWDPVDGLAYAYHREILAPVQKDISDGLSALQDLCACEQFKNLESEVAGVTFSVTLWICNQAWADPPRRRRFLQRLGAVLYYSERAHRSVGPSAFWKFLNARCSFYTDEVKKAPHTKSLITVVDNLCSRYGLGGAENVDIQYGLYRLLGPAFARAKAFLERETAGLSG